VEESPPGEWHASCLNAATDLPFDRAFHGNFPNERPTPATPPLVEPWCEPGADRRSGAARARDSCRYVGDEDPLPPPPPGLRPTLLVVDDDPVVLRILESIAATLDLEVITTQKSFGVLNIIAARHPFLVVLDVRMPGLDGPSLVTLIRADAELSGTIVLLHSAMDAQELEKQARECGADGYVSKSHGLRHLHTALESWIHGIGGGRAT
jgi:CheY-like chemotaxis protein